MQVVAALVVLCFAAGACGIGLFSHPGRGPPGSDGPPGLLRHQGFFPFDLWIPPGLRRPPAHATKSSTGTPFSSGASSSIITTTTCATWNRQHLAEQIQKHRLLQTLR
ncbi:hypothetical protein MRX96_035403 [Rhipicephalus microplus]